LSQVDVINAELCVCVCAHARKCGHARVAYYIYI